MRGDAAGGAPPAAGALVDCGLAFWPCANAAGKVCLIQRGSGYFCQKVLNCMAGGGVAALIYGRDDQPACEQVSGVTLLGACWNTPSRGWEARRLVASALPCSLALRGACAGPLPAARC